MSFNPINTSEITSGKPVTNELLQKVKDNFDNHEDRLTDLEVGTNVDYPPIMFSVKGPYSELTTAEKTGLLKTTINFSMQVTGIRIIVDRAGTSGSTSVNILKSSGGGSYVSLLSTQPSVSTAAGNDAVSTGSDANTTAAILNGANTLLAAGDILRLDLTSAQTSGVSFMVRIDYEKVG